ncbi:MAG: hypothetical protein KF745_12220 [Phycisphaeraceae bacterium]|nr:hypothetical protein [Phycisphaeraceae bacterium]
MNQQRTARRLIAANVLLLAGLVAVTLAGASQPSPQPGAGRARGEYTLVSGRMLGMSVHAVYILDASNQEMVALAWDRTTKRLGGIGYRDLAQDAKTSAGGR